VNGDMLKSIATVCVLIAGISINAATASTMPAPDSPAGLMLRNFMGMPVAGPVTQVPGDEKDSSREDMDEREDISDHHDRHKKRVHKKDHHRKGGDGRKD